MNLERELFNKIGRLGHLLNQAQQRQHHEQQNALDTSRGQGRILSLLKMKDGIGTKELSYILGIRVSSLNETLLKMKKKGLITRKPSKKDRRITEIYLTDKGRNMNFDTYQQDDLFDSFTQQEKEQLLDYLNRLIEKLDQRIPSHRNDQDEQAWKKHVEQMRDVLGEEWFEHVMTIHGIQAENEKK